MSADTAKCPYCGMEGHVEGYTGEDCPDNPNTARGQAKTQLDSILDMIDRVEHAGECNGCPRRNTLEGIEAEEYHNVESAIQAIDDDPLSVMVRSGWYTPGESNIANDEYEILLCTGGPAVRIRGELGRYSEPSSARIEYQDWGTPWTAFILDQNEEAVLLAYANHFYYGD